jgi:hypothetical protein
MPKSPHQPEIEWTHEKRAEFRRKRRPKNLALLGVLLAFVVLVYIVAVIRMGSG